MGRVKQMMLEQSEAIFRRIDELLEQAEDEIAQFGKLSAETSEAISIEFYKYSDIWPMSDTTELGRKLIGAVARGMKRAHADGTISTEEYLARR